MRLIHLATLAGSALAMAACGGGENKSADTAAAPAATTTPAGSTTTGMAPAAGAAAGAAAGGAAAAPITGTTHDVKMIGDAQGYRFDPKTITVKAGDGIRFTNVSGGPHNVTFWADSIPAGMQGPLSANMPNTMAPLTGPLLTAPNQTYVVSFAGTKPGTYHYYCTPHLAMGMTGVVTVQ